MPRHSVARLAHSYSKQSRRRRVGKNWPRKLTNFFPPRHPWDFARSLYFARCHGEIGRQQPAEANRPEKNEKATMTNTITRPTKGTVYYAPVALGSTEPLVFGERHGILVDERSQSQAVVYSTRDTAEAAFADRAVWSENSARRTRIAAIRYVGAGLQSFEFATEGERDAHVHARNNSTTTS